MANNFTSNPWTLDSTMASPITQQIKIRDIAWNKQNAAGDALVIVDASGKTILDVKASGQNVYERYGNIGWVHGLQVTTIGSGVVTIAI
jgi:hypothetical protein